MKTMVTACLMVIFAVSWSAVVRAAEVRRSELVMVWATLEAVDQDNRMVILRSPGGSPFDIKVGEGIQNLSKIRPGDDVMVRYYRSMLVQISKPNQQGTSSTTGGIGGPMPGQKLGGTVPEQITTTATILNIDNRNLVVTLKGSQGNVLTVKAADPDNLECLKVGEQISITYTQAVAISIE